MRERGAGWVGRPENTVGVSRKRGMEDRGVGMTPSQVTTIGGLRAGMGERGEVSEEAIGGFAAAQEGRGWGGEIGPRLSRRPGSQRPPRGGRSILWGRFQWLRLTQGQGRETMDPIYLIWVCTASGRVIMGGCLHYVWLSGILPTR